MAGNSNLAEIMNGLAEELKTRAAENESSGAGDFCADPRPAEFQEAPAGGRIQFFERPQPTQPNPAAMLQSLITEGPARGIHVIATCDTYNNVSRFLGRKTLAEFEMRVVFQMSASDSASLIESPDAGTLGLHRALYYNDREGYTETFRPYARPGNEWIEEVARALALHAI